MDKLCFSYIAYIFIVREFIQVEINKWGSQIATTKSMLNLFAATRPTNYAKACRIYIQSVEELKSINPSLHKQIKLGNHTVRRTGSNWSGIRTNLSIVQVLMKYLKGRSGIIRRGITDNTMDVWAKAMHR